MAADSNETSWVNAGLHAEALCIGNVPPTSSLGGGGGAIGYPCENFKKSYLRDSLTYSDDRKFSGELRSGPTVCMILTPSEVESKMG